MDRSFTHDMTQERYERIKNFVEKHNGFTSIGFFLNYSSDYMMDLIESKYLVEFMYYLGFPFLAFLGFVGLSLYFASLFFFILTAVVGFYLIVLFYLYYNKYRRARKRNVRDDK